VATGDTPTGLALSPNGREIWVADANLDPTPSPSGYQNNVTVISTTTDKVLGTIEWPGAGVLGIAFAPNGRLAYVSANGIDSGAGEGVEVVDTATFKVVGSLNSPASVFDTWSPASVAVTPDGKEVWVSSQSAESPTSQGYVFVFSAATDQEIGSVEVGEGSFFMTMSPDGKYAYVADKESCDIQEIDTQTFGVVAVVHTPAKYGCPYGIAATTTHGVVVTVTGSDHTLGLGNQGEVLERVNLNAKSVSVVDGVGTDPVTVTDTTSELAYVIDAATPLITVVDTRDDSIVGRLHLTAPVAHVASRV
jgi:DNA-binding beta-propeller fold protein YncE